MSNNFQTYQLMAKVPKFCFICPLWVQTRESCINSQSEWEEWSSSSEFVICDPSSPHSSLHGAGIMEGGLPSLALSYFSPFLCFGRLLSSQPHRLLAVPLAPLFRWHHRRTGSRVLPANRRDPLWRPRILDSGKHALQLEERHASLLCLLKLLIFHAWSNECSRHRAKLSLLQGFGWRISSTWRLTKSVTSWDSCTPWIPKLWCTWMQLWQGASSSHRMRCGVCTGSTVCSQSLCFLSHKH